MDEVNACFVCDVGELWQGLRNGVVGDEQAADEYCISYQPNGYRLSGRVA